MKIISVVGARPQFIKLAALSPALTKCGIEDMIVHTGQHYDQAMSEIFFRDLGIPSPSLNLGIGGGSHGQNTGRMLESLDGIFSEEKPDYILVYGDTDSTLAAALAGAKLHIPIIHVEAGLRSYNRKMPEEINRVLVDHLSDVLFAPTSLALRTLESEGLDNRIIHVVGDVMLDAAEKFAKISPSKAELFEKLGLKDCESYILATVHRSENTRSENTLRKIASSFRQIDQDLIVPIHPRLRESLNRYKIKLPPNVKVIEPQSFLNMVTLVRNSDLVITDSGGLQKEAFFHRKPCVTLRYQTEWVELVDLKCNFLAPPDAEVELKKIVELALETECDFSKKPYGDGNASGRIANLISSLKR